ncbi:filamentous_hemagglutinin N-terminal domain-containing protein [Hexamita inflata]|uniref:Filamentous hemagglutinin N-terminal domain-containing protein n=1 Tax=Hexamita inflata TaxID=28002 RepID=A0AA86UIE3_9EUKA|nr:filamentous hemagglutinin N-terminal domain-containing protein [Hexamita inflata]
MYKAVLCMPVYNKNANLALTSKICSKQLLSNEQQLLYCQKEQLVSSRALTSNIIPFPEINVHLSLYTRKTQDLILNLTYSMQNLPSFALFGLTSVVQLYNSNISVKIIQDLYQSSLLCFTCEVNVSTSDFVFITSGQSVSGLVLSPQTALKLFNSLVQFRLNGVYVGGLILNAHQINISLSQCNISGYVDQQNISRSAYGSIICFVSHGTILGVDNFRVCTNIKDYFGQGSLSLRLTGDIDDACVVCRKGKPAYGLCQENLKFGIEDQENNTFVCQSSFIFDGEGCSCKEGEVFNGTSCINILASVNLLKNSLIIINNSLVDLTNKTQVCQNINTILNNSQLQINLDILSLHQLSDQTHNIVVNNISELHQFVIRNFSQADLNLNFNTTELDKIIYLNISSLNTSIETLNNYSLILNDNFTQLNQSLSEQSTISVFLIQNITMLNLKLSESNFIIEQQQQAIKNLSLTIECLNSGAFVNNSVCSCGVNAINVSNTCVQVSCAISGQQSINGICQCVNINSIVQSGSCVCPINSSLVNNVCTCDTISGQTIVNGACQCPTGLYVVNDTCKQVNYEINISNFQCSQEIFNQQFDIQSITHQVTASSNFSAGYVFDSATVIQNAFIDISDNVYSTTFSPLFQSQSTFQNLKIQFGTQTFNSGSLLLSSSSVSLNQMNIISRPGSQLTVNSAKLLNVLTSSSSTTNITNLLVNLSFATSSGNITLINNINGVFNVSGYQVLGTYTSTGSVAMLGLNINSATVNVNEVNFKPTVFNVGNCSSYLFGNAATTSTIYVNNFAVILGSSSNFLLLGSIPTTSSSYYLFGGTIAYINSNSVVNINNVILDSYQQFSTSYVSCSGFLVGYSKLPGSSITIQNVCLQQNMTSTVQRFYWFGIIGYNYGNSSMQNINVAIAVQGADFYYFGIIGFQQGSVYSEIVNSRTSVIFNSGSGNYVGSLVGWEAAQNCSILNVSVVGGKISTGTTISVGGFIGWQTQNLTIQNSSIQLTNISGSSVIGGFVGNQQQNLTVMNSSIQQTNISGSSSEVGGFVGHQYQNLTIQNSSLLQINISGSTQVGGFVGYQEKSVYLTNSKIQSARLSSTGLNIGIVIGYSFSGSTVYYTNSSSAQIYVNYTLKTNCATLSNWQTGC